MSKALSYAVVAVAHIAREREPVAIKTKCIARTYGISLHCLEIVMGQLTRAGVLKSVVGRTGGHVLSRPAEKITLKDLMMALGQAVPPNLALPEGADQELVNVHQRLCEAMAQGLEGITVAGLIA